MGIEKTFGNVKYTTSVSARKTQEIDKPYG